MLEIIRAINEIIEEMLERVERMDISLQQLSQKAGKR